MKEKVLVGLSGGVDSAATVTLLRQAGYEVYGAYLSLCPEANVEKAREVARKMGVPFTVVNKKRKFSNRVIRPFVESYREGKTPNPCVECNRHLKVTALIEEADRLGIEKVATGHYACIEKEEGRYRLLRGKDRGKDQSYFLWRLTQKQLSRLLFPLGEMKKEEVRPFGEEFVGKKEKESMEICFIPDGDTQRFLEENGGRLPQGKFVDGNGNVLGTHGGIHRYTIGQRRGLGVSAGERIFVTDLDTETNRVVLGAREDLLTTAVRVEEIHFVSCTRKSLPEEGICMKGRNRGEPIPCKLEWDQKGVTALFSDPITRFSAGQSACFYVCDCLVFGGIIQK